MPKATTRPRMMPTTNRILVVIVFVSSVWCCDVRDRNYAERRGSPTRRQGGSTCDGRSIAGFGASDWLCAEGKNTRSLQGIMISSVFDFQEVGTRQGHFRGIMTSTVFDFPEIGTRIDSNGSGKTHLLRHRDSANAHLRTVGLASARVIYRDFRISHAQRSWTRHASVPPGTTTVSSHSAPALSQPPWAIP